MLTRIRLENFKSWEELDLQLSNITVLFGVNSSGKTSVIDSLLLLKQTVSSFDRALPVNLGGGEQDYVDFGTYQDLVYQHDTSTSVAVQLEWKPVVLKDLMGGWRMILGVLQQSKGLDENDETIGDQLDPVKRVSYRVEWRQTNKRVRVNRVEYQAFSEKDETRSMQVTRTSRDRYLLSKPDVFEIGFLKEFLTSVSQENMLRPFSSARSREVSIESCYTVSGQIPLRFDVQDFSREFEGIIDTIAYLGPLRDYPRRVYVWRGITPREIGLKGERTIDVLLSARRDRPTTRQSSPPDLIEQVSEWLKTMGLVDEFRIETLSTARSFYETRVKVASQQAENSLADVGFGVSQVLPVITLLFSVPEGSTVLMEQPEIHLHPCAQAQLADLFLHVAETRQLQLIVESHSEYFLRRLQRRVAEEQPEFASPEHIKMYFCKVVDGHSIAEPVDIDKYGQIKNWPKNFFGEVSEDMHALADAALARRRQELSQNG